MLVGHNHPHVVKRVEEYARTVSCMRGNIYLKLSLQKSYRK